jgi:hypothetical protein
MTEPLDFSDDQLAHLLRRLSQAKYWPLGSLIGTVKNPVMVVNAYIILC